MQYAVCKMQYAKCSMQCEKCKFGGCGISVTEHQTAEATVPGSNPQHSLKSWPGLVAQACNPAILGGMNKGWIGSVASNVQLQWRLEVRSVQLFKLGQKNGRKKNGLNNSRV